MDSGALLAGVALGAAAAGASAAGAAGASDGASAGALGAAGAASSFFGSSALGAGLAAFGWVSRVAYLGHHHHQEILLLDPVRLDRLVILENLARENELLQLDGVALLLLDRLLDSANLCE